MLFASNIFLFVFLPIVISIYYISPGRKFKNFLLLLASLLFYAWGEPKFVIIMLASIIFNYFIGLLLWKFSNNKKISLGTLIIGIVYNLGILFRYKYLMFVLSNVNNIFKSHIPIPNIILPIGISFFTFQILSYIIDVYRGKVNVQKNVFNLGLYISFFPQLIAGPIVRYETIQNQIMNRKEDFLLFFDGIERFVVGLGKKVIIANTMASIADYVFNQTMTLDISLATVWIGAIAYTLQIYYDFSGYSDMAIGLGKMFGFKFEENFNFPYISKSITEFWRRWHISLGTWFRDYVYIPLGGSRVNKKRLVFNLFVVWLLTGLWHGANWTFVAWGLLYFILLTLEKVFDIQNKKVNHIFRHIYTMLFVILGWVIFRSDSLTYAFSYMDRMFTFTNFVDLKFAELLLENIIILIIAVVLSLNIIKFDKLKRKKIFTTFYYISLVLVFIISISYIVKGVYNPFIYFNF